MSRRKLDLGGGGWFLLLSAVICTGVLLWHASAFLGRHGSRAVGDGRTVSSYGFDLQGLRVPREQLVASGLPKDGLRALVDPPTLPVSSVEAIRRERHRKFLVPDDRVIGVRVGGEARAYPLRVLNWHEIANDRLGGRLIAVTYNPLCDSSVVFDRELDGDALEFGVSGLLYNSNLVMYDRRTDPAMESLWSQLKAGAIAGPAARSAKRLAVLPSVVVRWEDWQRRYPETTVVSGSPALADAYKRDPYASYFGSDLLRFPVRPLAPDGPLGKRTGVIAVEVDGERVVFPLPLIARKAGPSGRWAASVRGARVEFTYREWPPTAFVEAGAGMRLETYHCFWFAWYAMHPGDRVWAPPPGKGVNSSFLTSQVALRDESLWQGRQILRQSASKSGAGTSQRTPRFGQSRKGCSY